MDLTADRPEPITGGEERATSRLTVLDLIRGVAVLGILPVHIGIFSGPGMYTSPVAVSWSDRVLGALVMLCFEGKMLTLLSILFGVGMGMQAREAQAAGRRFAPQFRRRAAVLFSLGLLHALFLFAFDILTCYAVAGTLALFFVRSSDRLLLRVAAGCVVWCCTAAVLLWALSSFAEPSAESLTADSATVTGQTSADEAAADAEPPEDLGFIDAFFSAEHETRVYREGSLWEMVVHRAVWLAILVAIFWAHTGWHMLAGILAGVWLARQGVLEQPGSYQRLLRGMVAWGLPLGALLHGAAVAAYWRDPNGVLPYCLVMAGMGPLACCYLTWLTRWAEGGNLGWLQRLLCSVGRMSLSNYLLQSVLCGFVFYGYGFGLYGRLDKAGTFGIVLAIWGLLLLVSTWWLRRFPMGPAEWVWRRLARRG